MRENDSTPYNLNNNISESFSYYANADNTLSAKVLEHCYTYTGTPYNGNNYSVIKNYQYEYYEGTGNIKLVLLQNNNNDYMPIAYYKYDEANRLTFEYDIESKNCIMYKYDNYGNMIEKTEYLPSLLNENYVSFFYKWLSFKGIYTFTGQNTIYNVTSLDEDTAFSNIKRSIKYNYSTNSNDDNNPLTLNKLDIDGNTYNIINDTLGQPNKYYSIDYNGDLIIGDCEWTGNLLTAFEKTVNNQQIRIEYTYDVNGYRTTKTYYVKNDTPESEFNKQLVVFYNWENGVLQGISIYDCINSELRLYSDIIYDINGEPIALQVPSGLLYIFQKDHRGNISLVKGLSEDLYYEINYDAYGNLYTDIADISNSSLSQAITDIIIMITGLFNPCSYNGMLYDYDTGLYFDQGRCYSPFYGRYLNIIDYNSLNNIIETPYYNPYTFANNNPINAQKTIFNAKSNYDATETATGFETNMNTAFLSRSYCQLFTKALLNEYGAINSKGVKVYKGMDEERISANLFAYAVGRYSEEALNRVNSVWCDGWLYKCRNANKIKVNRFDSNANKYVDIWNSSELIKEYSVNFGVYIV